MAILSFQRPDKVYIINLDDRHGSFEFRPLEPGYAITIGNALRRILLSSLEGFAITSVKIEGVTHEFSTIKGVLEDVTNIVLNLKQIRLKPVLPDVEHEKVKVVVSGKTEFTAGDITKTLAGFEVLNPELLICHLEKDVKLELELQINKGRGYIPSEENKNDAPIGTIFIDSIHTPVKNVQFFQENFRVEQKTDYEKLILNIDTDGSISPIDALKEAAKILIQHFMLFSDETITIDKKVKLESVKKITDPGMLQMKQLLSMKLSDMDLSVRALNCLRTAEIDTLADLVSKQRADLLKYRNFGKKSLMELEQLVKAKNLEFGMDIDKYFNDNE
ncbi:MAG: DNA-directed RNA polymerase subunit alpha [Bacteroidales bacterium]|jgi:DNA-directed RNA polymerase subunit alpha|nr:DNA-directed RNA polymerase subunit alpha [Bacteroidales bacterium]